MKAKRKPKFDLSQYSKLFLLLGFVGALLAVQFSIETKTYETVTTDLVPATIQDNSEEIEVPETKIEFEPLTKNETGRTKRQTGWCKL